MTHTIMIPAIAEDGSLYPIEKMEAHRKGVLHLAISAFVFNTQGQLLIQQRAHGKYHCGGLWANTCCSHPHWGEDIEACARRRLDDELGASTNLTPLGIVTYKADVGGGLIEHERVHMFGATVDAEHWPISPNQHEVAAVRWASLPGIQAEMHARAANFTPWFRLYMDQWQDIWAPAA